MTISKVEHSLLHKIYTYSFDIFVHQMKELQVVVHSHFKFGCSVGIFVTAHHILTYYPLKENYVLFYNRL